MTNEPTPVTDNQPPKVILWFRIYCGFLCLLYLGLVAFSLFLFLVGPADADLSPVGARVAASLLLVLGLGLFAVCALPLFLRPRPWVWIYDLVVICFGMTSMCTLPASIPLLVFWLKPETKRHFGKS